MTYDVIALDVWGHASAECAEYDCPGGDRCEGFQVNDRWRVGSIEVSEAAYDAAIVLALEAKGFLTPHGVACAEIEDNSDGTFLEVVDRETREPFFHLEARDESEGA